MDFRTLMIRAQPQLPTMLRLREQHAQGYHVMVVLLFGLSCLASCGPCSMTEFQNAGEYDEFRSYRDGQYVDFQEAFAGDGSSGFVSGYPVPHLSHENVCKKSNLLCFPSTLPGFLSGEHNAKSTGVELSAIRSDFSLPIGSNQETSNSSGSSDSETFEFIRGSTVSCSVNLVEGFGDVSFNQTTSHSHSALSSFSTPLLFKNSIDINKFADSYAVKSGYLSDSSSLIEISPSLLDWGQKYMYFPSFAFLTVANTQVDSVLSVYEPFSTNSQFYPCNFSEIMLVPGEVASICFVFLPTSLGLSSAHLVLQTSSGGFLIQAKGFAMESPYKIQPLTGLEVSSSGRWRKNLSLFNPFNETLYVEEVTAWVSVSSRDGNHSVKAICTVNDIEPSADCSLQSSKDWLDVRNGQMGLPVMALRPRINWGVGPYSTGTVVELDFSYHSKGKIFGAFYLQLLRSSKHQFGSVVVPLEAELGEKSAYGDSKNSVSVSLEPLVPCDASEKVVVIVSLENTAAHALSVVKIGGIERSTKLLQIKHMEGLLLFPGTVTQAAVITYSPLASKSHDNPFDVSDDILNCQLVIFTNDSASPRIEIPCYDIANTCLRSQFDPYIGHEHDSGNAEYGNGRIWSLSSGMQSWSQTKAVKRAEADELVLENWKSHGTASGMSVLDDHDLLFPAVPIGTHSSKLITVTNPSNQSVLMQLILNSGEIVDECQAPDGLLQPSSGSLAYNIYNSAPRYGFSLAASALTEAYIHPYSSASFGPIFFRPGNRCVWKSSVLIRNNLSGVEWLSLRGFGGLSSLVLLEGNEPVQSLEFKFNLPNSQNLSHPDEFYHMKDSSYACSLPLSKELYVKNTGDLPLEVSNIKVSGFGCGLDGFVVRTCKGFALDPGESIKLEILYQTDFSAPMVHRDLELALATGILTIPMKASLPVYMLNFCKKSVFWMRVKKTFIALLAALVVLLLCCCFFPQVMGFGLQDLLFKREKSSVTTTKHAGKSPHLSHNRKSSKSSIPGNNIIRKGEASISELVSRCSDGQGLAPDQAMSANHVNQPFWCPSKTNCSPDVLNETDLASFSLSKSVAVESSSLQGGLETGKLTVRTGKEKGRRQRRKGGSGTVLAGLFEVSSSQSGNSTPSPPLSPAASVTSKKSLILCPGMDQSVESWSPCAQVTSQQNEKSSGTVIVPKAKVLDPEISVKCNRDSWSAKINEKPCAKKKLASKPVLLPSATFPCAGRPAPNLVCYSPILSSKGAIAPHARAPGSKLYGQNTIKPEEASPGEDKFKYDIWGEHLFGLHLADRSKEVAVSPLAKGNYSDSFFETGPQALLKNS